MSQEKAQLIAPLGNVTFTGVTATGVITATSLSGNITGSASSIVQGTSITAGVVTASSFAGNLTGNIQRLADSAPNISVGVVTATSFSGNLTGSVTDLTSQPAITVGVVTATRFSGPVTGDIRGNVTGNVSGVATGNVTGNVDGDITGNVTGTIAGNVTGDVTGNASGHAGGLGVSYNGGWTGAGTSQISVGVITATVFHGDGSTLSGVSGGPVSQQAVTIDGAATSIDLSSGNLIYATQSASTTVSFANSENGNVYFVRTQADGDLGTRTITWPTGIGWSGGEAPTLLNNPTSGDAQIFLLVTRDMGETWYGKEVFSINEESYSLWSWGGNTAGVAGQNNRTAYSSPIQIGTGTNWKELPIGGNTWYQYHTGAVKTDGTMWMWGAAGSGELGLNDVVTRSSPTQIPGTTWSNLSVDGSGKTTAAVKTDGTMWITGYNFYGQLGLNVGVPWPGPNHNLGTKSSPTQIPGTTWHSASAGVQGYLARKTDGTLWSWGSNTSGVLGLGDNTRRSSPTQIPGTTWSTVGVGYNNATALKTDGSLWTWGVGQEGGGGHNNITSYSSPRQVGTDTTWSTFSAGYYANMATKTDGTLWTWGSNNYGKLGLNAPSLSRVSSPTQIGTGTDWAKAGMITRFNGYAFKADGSAYAWGRGSYGMPGLNDQTQRSSPTQIPGSWSSISATYWGAMMIKPT
jgi:hypothetical protein